MLKTTLSATLALAGLAFLSSVQAAGCGTPRNAFDTVYCASNLFAQSDKSLNQTYGELRKQLPADQQAVLKQSQLAWIKQRDSQCAREEADGYFVNLDCAVSLTDSRLEVLKERLRECASTGCEAGKLGQ
ncbi:MAG: lysozyme inhibitor LprI family protein [Pseudomonas oryzihabitans]